MALDLNPCPHCKNYFCPGCVTQEDMDNNNTEAIEKKYKAQDLSATISTNFDEIISFLNTFGYANQALFEKAIAKSLTTTHRTIQQKAGYILLKTIVDFFVWEDDTNRTDGRNEAIAKLCKELKPIIDESYIPEI
jgi:hypothetical protein